MNRDTNTNPETYGSGEGAYDADFEIIDEGFDDETGEIVTIGVDSPDHSILTIFNNDMALHILAETDEAKEYDPRGALMRILEQYRYSEGSDEWLASQGMKIQIDLKYDN